MPSKRFLGVFLSVFQVLAFQAWGAAAHSHGHSTWSLAFEGLQGKLVVDAPGESVLGFEHEPKKKADHLKVSEALIKFEKKLPEMVSFPADLSCVWTKKTLEVLREENNKKHCEVEAEFQITCAINPEGATVVFNIQKHFPRFHEVQLEVLIGNVQKSQTIKKSKTTVDLK